MNGSYQFEKLESRFEEASLLAERAQMRLEGFTELLDRHGFPHHGRALDVGCGHGIRSELMAKHRPGVEVLGIDRSSELLELVNAKTSLSNLAFQKADLYELPFADQSFDFIYSRLVFMHLTDPLAALNELKRVLKPGGRILIEDADRDCMLFEPVPSGFPEYWKKIQEGQRNLGGDPNVGRRLARYLRKMQFNGVKIEIQPYVGTGKDVEFLARSLFPSLNCYLKEEDRKEGDEMVYKLFEFAKTPEASVYHFWFVVSGVN